MSRASHTGYLELRSAIDRSYRQFQSAVNELAELDARYKKSHGQRIDLRPDLLKSLLLSIDGPKLALEAVIKEAAYLCEAANDLPKGTRGTFKVQALGQRGELRDKTERLLEEAKRELKLLKSFMRMIDEDERRTLTAQNFTEFLDEAPGKLKYTKAIELQPVPGMDVINGVPKPDAGPGEIAIGVLALLMAKYMENMKKRK